MFRGLGPGPILAVALSLPGCDPPPADQSGAAEQPTFTVHDSAGVEIVENHAPQWSADEFWTIDPAPEIVLGGAGHLTEAANDPSHLVWRVVGLARLQDGRVAVLSSGNKQLMLFDPSGELSRIVGGPGEGPGEFTRPLALQYLPPDTLVVWDYYPDFDRLLRYRRNAPEGTLARFRQDERPRGRGRIAQAPPAGWVLSGGGPGHDR